MMSPATIPWFSRPRTTADSPVATAARAASGLGKAALRRARDGGDDLEGGANGALGIVFAGHGRAPDADHRIADELLDGAAEARHDPPGRLEVARQDVAHLLRVQRLGEAGEVLEVAEQDRDQPAFGRRFRRAGPRGSPGRRRMPTESAPPLASTGLGWWLCVSVRGLPQAVQKLNPAGTSVPQRPQVTASGWPQVPQNCAPGGFSNPQAVGVWRDLVQIPLPTVRGRSAGGPVLGLMAGKGHGVVRAVHDGLEVHEPRLQCPVVPERWSS